MTALPTTKKRDPAPRRASGYLLGGLAIVVLVALVWALLAGRGFEPGEKMEAEGIKDVAVSEEDTLYPPSDVLRFSEAPAEIYVYVAVDGLPSGTKLTARVDRAGRESVLGRLFSSAADIEVVDGQEDQLSPASRGVAGVVKFAVRTRSGESLPAGNYTVIIRRAGANVQDSEVARKLFVVRG
ncbi:MAG TPA: hypothetical protein VFJ72_16845 [Rubrobacteraceae bacterium]|nr:hypothetical protein [Rubrobacteraceae bacterium]